MPSDTPTLPASDDTADYKAGQLVGGKYLLESLLGEGGMGSVFRAHNTALNVAVAIKLISGTSDRKALRARLLQEARAAARLRHPAIVRVFDVGETDHGDPFIVMELLEGETLAQHLAGAGKLSPIDAACLLLPIADALYTAHTGGIVHRDVKPENILIANDGRHLQPKLVDFGIVRIESDERRLTLRGEFVGTPEYMSPEQARGRTDLGFATDVWSFCAVLYEAVAGRQPFESENYHALLRAIIEQPLAALHTFGIDDPEFCRIVEKGLVKEEAERHGSMLELGTALAEWLLARGVREDAAGRSLEARWLTKQRTERRTSSRPPTARSNETPLEKSSRPPPDGGQPSTHENQPRVPAPGAARVSGWGRLKIDRQSLAFLGLALFLALLLFLTTRGEPEPLEPNPAAENNASMPAGSSLSSAVPVPQVIPVRPVSQEPPAEPATATVSAPSAPTPAPSTAPKEPVDRSLVPQTKPTTRPGTDLLEPF